MSKGNSDILEKILNEVENFKKRKEEWVKELRDEFPKLITPLLERSEYIENISWTQYTPYFNDGEECYFTASVDYLYVNGADQGDSENDIYEKNKSFIIKNEEDLLIDKEISEQMGWKFHSKKIGQYGYKMNMKYNEDEAKLLKDIKKVLLKIPSDFYKDLFGDHVKVTITKKGEISIEEYEHE